MIDEYKIIIRPMITEKIFNMIKDENKLVFEVNRKANKHQIKQAIEKLYDVKVVKVNTHITPQGKKHAIIKLKSPEYSADELASKLRLY